MNGRRNGLHLLLGIIFVLLDGKWNLKKYEIIIEKINTR